MFAPENLLPFFAQYPADTYLIAFSGGLDSLVLLHACAGLRGGHPHLNFRALHVDHGLQEGSVAWSEHCRKVCQQLAVPFESTRLQLRVAAGASLEAVAREARYRFFAQQLQPGEMLLTAHHRNDQAETLLLNLARGSGTDGLASMPVVRPFAAGRLGRPLLEFPRSELEHYAKQRAFEQDFVEDPSNMDTRFDRNYLRHEVMPALQERWPAIVDTLARAARLQSESKQLLAGFLQERLASLTGQAANTLSVSKLREQPGIMQKALLREWLDQQGLPRPAEQRLFAVLAEVLTARPDATPKVCWKGCEIRRYRDDLYALKPLSAHDPQQVLHWEDTMQPLFIRSLQRTLSPRVLEPWQAYLKHSGEKVTVRFRQGGESLLIPWRGGTHSLKKLLQEVGVAPWERERLPLIYVGERLVGIIGVLQVSPEDTDDG